MLYPELDRSGRAWGLGTSGGRARKHETNDVSPKTGIEEPRESLTGILKIAYREDL